ncbi:MAG: sugar ABC transporter ATP-binding protein [Firmicutes bacterium]|nr:sugar ABC transporter ATP-binding protein [Bacillota bacterium]
MTETKKILEMRDIVKSFSGVQVLKKVSFDVNEGEVHALIGENGAGKSTLIKILTGVYPKDSGDILIDNEPVEINSRQDASKAGIGVVYQDLSLIPTLTITENIMLGKETTRLGILEHKKMNKLVRDLIEEYKFDLDPTAVVGNLSIAQQQMVEILKVLSVESRVIIMDEPTAALTENESEKLFTIIGQLKEKGVGVVYISHRLEEVFRLADRLTILRNGEKVTTLLHDEIVPAEAIKMMIGKDVSTSTASRELHDSTEEVVLDVKNISSIAKFKNISFQVHKGEILGIGGLLGSGRTEVVRSIYGADPIDSGEVLYMGEPLKTNVGASIGKGIGLIPEERRRQGLVPLLSIGRNVALPNYDSLTKAFLIDKKKEKNIGVESVKALDIRPADDTLVVGNLSGGNQQKVVVGKWLARDLKLLLVDEPTVGIDIGAKDEIYKILDDLAAKGVAIIVVSSDLQELLRVSHRILIFRKGRVFEEFNSGTVTQEDILMAASGIKEEKQEALA